MATLVLTVAGGVIGGPIGAAIGGLIGNAADHAIFRPPPREGPRLTDLSVQTSSYGSPIPRLFGTMRVAGTVIWATDLAEHSASDGGGKGAATTTYSYTASFAVALSGRPILSVGRIWADGNLLRGGAGDWKAQTGFRLHTGGEEQAPDPLIAAIETIGLAPAHRGIAYAVFEDLALADFGNRIPSLTFEVTADAAPVPVGAIAADLTGGIVSAGPTDALAGFAAHGESALPVIGLLAEAAGGWFAAEGTGIALRTRDGPAGLLADDGAGEPASGGGVRQAGERRPIETVPRTLSIGHYDPARDYQTGMQTAQRPGPGHGRRHVAMPAVLDAGAARTMAQAMLDRAESERSRRRITTDLAAIATAPGDRVTIDGEGGLWRVTGAAIEGGTVAVDLLPVTPATLPLPSTAGRAVAAPDLIAGTTILEAFEIPALDETLLAQPRVSIAATGTGPGWRRAALLHSIDGGLTWQETGATAAPAVIGTVAVAPLTPGEALIDRASAMEVELARDDMTLLSADAAAIDRGANLALAGDELIQFATAERIGARRWRLGALRRGRRATIAPHVAGERFVLIAAETIATLTLPVSAIGGAVRIRASGIGDGDTPAEAIVPVPGASCAPPPPVHPRAEWLEDGTVRLSWIRRSRSGWTWRDGVDAPLGEEREAYRLELERDGAIVFAATPVTPAQIVPAAHALPGTVMRVRQIGTIADSAWLVWVIA